MVTTMKKIQEVNYEESTMNEGQPGCAIGLLLFINIISCLGLFAVLIYFVISGLRG